MSDKIFTPDEEARHKAAMENVADWLKHFGVTQRSVAEYLGMSPAQVSKWLSGKNRAYLIHMVSIATFLNVTLEELLGKKPGFNDLDVPLRGKFVEDCQALLLLSHWEVLSDDSKSTIMKIISTLADADQTSRVSDLRKTA